MAKKKKKWPLGSFEQAKTAGEIRFQVDFVTGSIGVSTPRDVMKYLLEDLIQIMTKAAKTHKRLGMFEMIVKTGHYEAWKTEDKLKADFNRRVKLDMET